MLSFYILFTIVLKSDPSPAVSGLLPKIGCLNTNKEQPTKSTGSSEGHDYALHKKWKGEYPAGVESSSEFILKCCST